jgi:hypothetical protein
MAHALQSQHFGGLPGLPAKFMASLGYIMKSRLKKQKSSVSASKWRQYVVIWSLLIFLQYHHSPQALTFHVPVNAKQVTLQPLQGLAPLTCKSFYILFSHPLYS